MRTYQDLLAIEQSDKARGEFVRRIINEHKASDLYHNAVDAELYFKHQNVTINDYRKMLYTISGKAVPDNISANWKMAADYFHRFVTQEVQYLLGNGVTLSDDKAKDKLGKSFDKALQKACKYALIGGVSFGFWNLDHLEVFKITEFAPLYDEENGALRAGVRFWQIDGTKPLRATLYEPDGYTEFIWRKSKGEVLHPKKKYITKMRSTPADGTEIYDFENYPSFPIVPLWGNPSHQSELTGIREQIDCYDLIKSGFANDLDDASQIYWIIQNGGGMDDLSLAKFVERIKTVRAAVVEDDGARAESHTIEVPYASREALLNRIERDIYRDAMALDTAAIASGAVAIVQIEAAYEPLNSKCDDLEYCVLDFLDDILELAGLPDENPTFTRSRIMNVSEQIGMVIESAPYLSEDYVTTKILTFLGDGDMAADVLAKMASDELDRAGLINTPTDEESEAEDEIEASDAQ